MPHGLSRRHLASGALSPLDTRRAVVAAMPDADYTLSAGEYHAFQIEFAGTLTAGRNVILPTVASGVWIVENATTGGFALTFKTAAGSGVAVAAGTAAIVRCDSVNIVRASADV